MNVDLKHHENPNCIKLRVLMDEFGLKRHVNKRYEELFSGESGNDNLG